MVLFKTYQILAKTLVLSTLVLVGLQACTPESTISETPGNVCVQPEAISFTKNQLAESLRTTTLRLTYESANIADLEAIRNASSVTEARTLYNNAIDSLVDSTQMRPAIKNFFIKKFGVWSDDARQPEMRQPVNLATYIFLAGKSIDELFLADYAVDDNFIEIDATYSRGPAKEQLAGFITLQAYLDAYIDNQFRFNIVREVLGNALNDTAPYTNIDIYRWSPGMLSPLYRFDPTVSDELDCQPCHVVNNWARLVFRNYINPNNGAELQATTDQVLPNIGFVPPRTQFMSEDQDKDNPGNALEPRNPESDMPYLQEDITNYIKLTETGPTLDQPRDLALALVAHEAFAPAWTENILALAMGMETGNSGPNKVVARHFSETDAQKTFLAKWTGVFEANGRVPKELFREFLKDNQFLAALVHDCEQ